MIGLNWDITDKVLAEKQLVTAKEQAEAAGRAKADFLAVMSHEIRTPLNGVLGLAGMLRDSRLDDKQRDILQQLHTCGDSLLVLINDILDFSKIEAGKLELEDEEFGLRHTIDDAITLVSDRVNAKGLELITVLDEGIPDRLRGDQTRLRQVLANLLSNAVKFTQRGHITIRVKPLASRATEKPGALRLEFTVADTGIGMTAEAQANLFQPFCQGDRSTTRRFGGTGLGLAICKRLVGCMGGDISAESQPEVGTTFRFDVSLRTSGTCTAATCLRGMRLLLQVGSVPLRESLTEQFKNWGATSVHVSKEEVMQTLSAAAAKGEVFHGLLVDGQTVVDEALRAASGAGACRVIDMSGQPDSRADLVLSRPLRLGQLRRQLLDIKQSAPARNRSSAVVPPLRGHVLLAEDNPVNQRVATHLLGKLGLTYDLAADGNEAITAYERRAYDLVLMDCMMPERDGLAATRCIREQEKAKGAGEHLPIIALSAGVTSEEQQATAAAGMDAFLAKPIQFNEMANMLARWLPPATSEKGKA